MQRARLTEIALGQDRAIGPDGLHVSCAPISVDWERHPLCRDVPKLRHPPRQKKP
jgi:hypothetical protein